MLRKLRRISPFAAFWFLFYAVAIVGLIVPEEVGQWFAVVLAAPGFLAVSFISLCIVSLTIGAAGVFVFSLFKRGSSDESS
jgi:hypothetical protein